MQFASLFQIIRFLTLPSRFAATCEIHILDLQTKQHWTIETARKLRDTEARKILSLSRKDKHPKIAKKSKGVHLWYVLLNQVFVNLRFSSDFRLSSYLGNLHILVVFIFRSSSYLGYLHS